MNYLDGIRAVHEALQPRSYVEIGCRFGDSLALASCPSVAVDPINRINVDVTCDYRFFEMTSDDFFARYSLVDLLGGPLDLGFIDGMHLAEFALRDFVNLERESHPASVILMDDVLPRENEFAGREPEVQAWCGDVYKAVRLLKALRPDLRVRVFDVAIKGFCVIDRLDPHNSSLGDQIDSLESQLEGGLHGVKDVKDLRDEFDVEPIEALSDLAFN